MSNPLRIFAFLVLLGAPAWLMIGCSDATSGCRTDEDCRSGRVCVANVCIDSNLPELDMSMPDDGSADGGMDQDPDSGDMPNDQPVDMPNPDMGQDSGPDMGQDSGTDMGQDSGQDSGTDMDQDSGTDMDQDSGTDMDQDSGTDMGQDSGTDMGQDSGQDSGTDMDMGVIGPQIQVLPDVINYGSAPIGTTSTSSIQIRNIGDANLVLTSVNLGANPSQAFAVTPIISPANPTIIAPGDSEEFVASFAPTANSNFRNTVQFDSNDADDPVVETSLRGRGTTPSIQSCFFATPSDVDFGVVPPPTSHTQTVTIGNCSSLSDVTVTAATVLDSNGPFSVTLLQPTPFTLAPGATQAVTVQFAPTGLPDVSDTLRFRTDAISGTQRDVDLLGSGGGCIEPIALGDVQMDPIDSPRSGAILVSTMEIVQLDASQTETPSGTIDATWTVTVAPSGSTAVVSGGNFAPDMPGEYELSLDVTDPITQTPSCAPTTLKIVSIGPLIPLRAGLTWTAGHDLDLHLVRDDSAGMFNLFHPLNDAHYDNLNPDWGVANVATDDAFHHGDDTDGFGPEIVDLAALESGRRYRAIVQFGRRQGFNPPRFDATLRLRTHPIGPAVINTLTHSFRITQVGTYWITFEVDGTNGTITSIDTTM